LLDVHRLVSHVVPRNAAQTSVGGKPCDPFIGGKRGPIWRLPDQPSANVDVAG